MKRRSTEDKAIAATNPTRQNTDVPAFWRSLEEYADSPAFQAQLADEFPHLKEGWGFDLDRRQFLTLAAASAVLASMSGCTRQPPEKIVPRTKAPEYQVPGRPEFFASAFPFRGFAQPILVESHGFRPTRIEGNELHPACTRACTAITQASIWDLYNPGRAQAITHHDRLSSQPELQQALRDALDAQHASQGAGIRFLTEPTSSPTLMRQMEAFRKAFPRATWHQYTPFSFDNERAGIEAAFGRPLAMQHDFRKADLIVSFENDFLMSAPAAIANADAFADRRRVREGTRAMSRFHAAETYPTVSGASADYRLAADHAVLGDLVVRLAAELGAIDSAPDAELNEKQARWLQRVVEDLRQAKGRSVVLAGDALPPCLHALTHAINERLGNIGKTVRFTQPMLSQEMSCVESLSNLCNALNAGSVTLLIVIGGNPVFDAPADMKVADAIGKAMLSIRMGLFDDETSARCDWHVPHSHSLESWSDLRTTDGTATLIQPLIAPLFRSLSPHELLHMMLAKERPDPLNTLKDTWRDTIGREGFEKRWRRAVHDGFIADTAFKAEDVSVTHDAVGRAIGEYKTDRSNRKDGLRLEIRPNPSIWDGSYANNPWLQELPDPITKLTWGNAAMISPRTSEATGLTGGNVEVTVGDATIELPLVVLPGMADETIGLTAGSGRTIVNQFGTHKGTDVYPIRRRDGMWSARVRNIDPSPNVTDLACTQTHHSMEGRDLLRTESLDSFAHPGAMSKSSEHAKKENGDVSLSLYPDVDYSEGPKWGMMIDLTSCIGCNACTIACQAENNIPTVGYEQVLNGREMHWIRVDRYFGETPEEPEIAFQPVPCMQCENAPCEYVCPVGATLHSTAGLNEMVYNRCVGTRYCSNNCPYKVRRFNFLTFNDYTSETLKLMRNPDVTVRSRGVMEKCTYCIQRISHARIEAKKERRDIRDGEIVTACQGACPTQAIVFGDLNDPKSDVSNVYHQPHRYGLLTELNTRPRTNYLKRVRNRSESEGRRA